MWLQRYLFSLVWIIFPVILISRICSLYSIMKRFVKSHSHSNVLQTFLDEKSKMVLDDSFVLNSPIISWCLLWTSLHCTKLRCVDCIFKWWNAPLVNIMSCSVIASAWLRTSTALDCFHPNILTIYRLSTLFRLMRWYVVKLRRRSFSTVINH